jgi:hypothetical protein
MTPRAFEPPRKRRFPAWLCASALVVVWGMVRLPMEGRLTAAEHAAGFATVSVGLPIREQLGQFGFLAALSGFRSVVADFVWLDAYAAWERVEYGRLNLLCHTATTLQPRNVEFWDTSAWQMAWNASVHAREDLRGQPREALRRKAEHEYVLLGKNYAERGIANNPDARALHERLALIEYEKLRDPCAAAAAYARAAGCPKALGYEKRFAAFRLAECPGHEREAYWLLRFYYDLSERERVPTLVRLLRELEEKIALPPEQRVDKTR